MGKIFLFALCSLFVLHGYTQAASPITREEVAISKVTLSVFENLEEHLKAIKEKIQEDFRKFSEIVSKLIERAKTDLKTLIDNIKATINKLVEGAKECVGSSEADLDILYEKAITSVQECVENTKNKGMAIVAEVRNEAENILALKDQLLHCDTVSCAFQVLQKVFKLSLSLPGKAKKIYKEINALVVEASDEVPKCIDEKKNILVQDATSIVETIKKCVDENQQPAYMISYEAKDERAVMEVFGIFDNIKRDLQKKIQDAIKAISEKFDQFLEFAKTVIEQAKGVLKEVIERVKEQILDIAQNTKECYGNSEEDLENLYEEAVAAVNECVQDTSNKALAIVQEAQNQINEFLNKFFELEEKFENCDAIFCYMGVFYEGVQYAKTLPKQAKVVIEMVAKLVSEASQQVPACVDDKKTELLNEANAIVDTIRQCVADHKA